MPKRAKLEAAIYNQKKAYKRWLGELAIRELTPPEEASELVWELLVSYGESVNDPHQAREDVRQTAYELASLVLNDHSIEEVYKTYRNLLMNAVVQESGELDKNRCQSLVVFADLISTAFCEAHSDRLKRTIRHNRTASLSSELRLAKRIQGHLLPKVIPEIPGFEFAGRLIPAEEVGGDYWSIKHYPQDGRVTMKLADISGHGVAAATLVAAVKFISGGYYRGSKSPSEVVAQTNRVLIKETPYDILVTMAYGWLHPETYELDLVNAGQEPVFVCGTNKCRDISPGGTVLGVTETEYREEKVLLEKDDVVFFGSDGLTEAGIGEQFGKERLKNLVVENAHLSADEIADLVIRTVIDYAKQPHDDMSLLVTKVTGEPPERG